MCCMNEEELTDVREREEYYVGVIGDQDERITALESQLQASELRNEALRAALEREVKRCSTCDGAGGWPSIPTDYGGLPAVQCPDCADARSALREQQT